MTTEQRFVGDVLIRRAGLTLDRLEPLYANFVRVAGLPEEMVLDFGLNPQPFGAAPVPVKVSQRLIVNYFTAKRLWLALGAFLQRHEQVYGAVEIDVTKRILPQAQRPAQ